MTDTPASWNSVREDVLADDATRAEHERLEERMRLVRAVIVARTERGWSQRDLATASGLAQPAVARFEKAIGDPRFGTVTRICAALELRVQIGGEVVVAGAPARAARGRTKDVSGTTTDGGWASKKSGAIGRYSGKVKTKNGAGGAVVRNASSGGKRVAGPAAKPAPKSR